MGLADTVEPRLMRTMVEAVKQHRLRRERDDVERGDWAEGGPEPISARATMQTAYPTLKQVDGDKALAAQLLGITARTIYRREAEWREHDGR